MKLADLVKIALYNIRAGKQMVKKIVFGMVVINILIICFVTIITSYFNYKDRLEQKHKSDCYYYLPIEEQILSSTALKKIQNQGKRLNEKYCAQESAILCNLGSIDETAEFTAGKIKMVLDGNVCKAVYKHTLYSKTNFYKNVDERYKAIEFAVFYSGMTIFPDYLKSSYGKEFMVGEYPDSPGEIMVDDYILSVYGLDEKYDELIGKTISFLYYDDERKNYIFKDYKLTGIFSGDILSKRENVYTSDMHIEHIYINVREEDMEQFHITYGSIRCYFNTYTEYVSHYGNVAALLQLDLDNVLFGEEEIKLTAKGMTYCIIHFFMENIGRLLFMIAAVIVLVITFSILYIFKFYMDRQKKYRIMLSYIGMENRDEGVVAFIETFFMFLVASIIGIYFSVVFLLVLNYITRILLDFAIVISVTNCILSVLCSWLYFAIFKKGLVLLQKSFI